MAEPKKRTNNSKQGMRRMHDKKSVSGLNYCPNCKEPKRMHSVCDSCGFYNGKLVIEQKKEKTDSSVKE
ncbi:MAG: 50S ribosomal protein L32 [Patescibacteria group bacterium]|jgi:large subunit ribosomal protein L32